MQNYTLVNWDARNSFSFGVYLCTFSIFCHTMTLKTQINRCVYLFGEYADGSICTNANECKFKRSPNWLHVCIYVCILWIRYVWLKIAQTDLSDQMLAIIIHPFSSVLHMSKQFASFQFDTFISFDLKRCASDDDEKERKSEPATS